MRVLITAILISLILVSSSQNNEVKKPETSWYAAWGYTKAYFSKSNIHFKDRSGKFHPETGLYNDYDFTIYNATATDRPDFNKIKDVINITIPQFVLHLGYSFNDKWGFELNYDHTKYIVDDYQKVHIKGQIFGQQIDKDTILEPARFLHFEHSDGANFMLFNAVRRWTIYNPSKKFRASWVVKAGPGFVYPRTQVSIFGETLNNDWHISGWIVSAETGLRLEFLKHGFFEFVGKGSYADYTKALLLGKGNGSASHHFYCGQLTATLGYTMKGKR